MKICPQCRAEFEADMNFCLQDGTPLVIATSGNAQTLNLPMGQNLPPTQDFFNQQSQPTLWQKDRRTENPPPKLTAESPNYVMFKPDSTNSNKSSVFLFSAIIGGLLLVGIAVGWIWTMKQNRETADFYAELDNRMNSAKRTNENSNSSPNSANKNAANVKTNSNPNTTINPNVKQNAVKGDKSLPKNAVIDPDLPDNKVSTPQNEKPKTISGGVLNGKATYLEKPAYPAAARAVRASGAVNVQVTIDEQGNVISASAVSGHALLRSSAVQAARNSKFSPTMLSGQPVKVTGVIVYNFVP